MKTLEFRAMNNADLAHRLDEAYQEMFNLRFQRATGKLTNTARMNTVHKEIARMKTILRERELAGAA